MRIIKSLVTIAVLGTMFSCGNQQLEVKSLETGIDSASYALGMDMALKIKANFNEAKTDLFLQGYRNGMDSTNLLIEQKDLMFFLSTFFSKTTSVKKSRNASKIR